MRGFIPVEFNAAMELALYLADRPKDSLLHFSVGLNMLLRPRCQMRRKIGLMLSCLEETKASCQFGPLSFILAYPLRRSANTFPIPFLLSMTCLGWCIGDRVQRRGWRRRLLVSGLPFEIFVEGTKMRRWRPTNTHESSLGACRDWCLLKTRTVAATSKEECWTVMLVADSTGGSRMDNGR